MEQMLRCFLFSFSFSFFLRYQKKQSVEGIDSIIYSFASDGKS